MLTTKPAPLAGDVLRQVPRAQRDAEDFVDHKAPVATAVLAAIVVLGIGNGLVAGRRRIAEPSQRFDALHEYYEPENGEPILNRGFQNWNYLVLNMIEWLKGNVPVAEFGMRGASEPKRARGRL